jgi:hypothetical protein
VPWFAAHIIEYLKCLDGDQAEFMAWENIVLLEAPDADEAWRMAEARAGEAATPEDSLYLADGRPCNRFGDRPARWLNGGVRKIIAVSHERPAGVLGSGDEVTFNTLYFKTEAEIKAYGQGDDAQVLITEPGGPNDDPEEDAR